MQKILVQSSTIAEAEAIKSVIEKRLPYDVRISTSFQETEEQLSTLPYQLFIYDSETLTPEQLNQVKEVKALGFSQPILILATTVPSISDKQKITVLQKPFEPKALQGITRKLLIQRSIQQQMHRRFRTQQKAQIETFLNGEVFETQMYNLSRGGAYCEFPELPRALGIGEIVRLKVRIDECEKSYTMNARVVWTTRKGAYSGVPGIGVKFVKQSDVYRHLLEKF